MGPEGSDEELCASRSVSACAGCCCLSKKGPRGEHIICEIPIGPPAAGSWSQPFQSALHIEEPVKIFCW